MVADLDIENIFLAAIVKKNPGYSESNILCLVLLGNEDPKDPRRYEHMWSSFNLPTDATQAYIAKHVLRLALKYVSPSRATTLHLTVPFEPSSNDLEQYPRLELETTPQKQNPAWPLLVARVSQMRGF
jgi:hypothetical protein